MPVLLLVVFLAVGWTLTGVLYVFRIRGLREANEFLNDAQSEAAMRAIDAERDAARAEEQAAQLKTTLLQVLQRPAVVGLTEENVQQLGALIQAFITKPNQMN